MSEPIRDVLLVVADQWRADALGLLGTPGVVTPNLDALARRSVAFTNHWCQASPCGPARSTLLTGTELATHGQWTNDQPAEHGLPTLPDLVDGRAPLLIGYTDTPTGDLLHDPGFEVLRPFYWQRGFPAYRRYLEDRGHGPLGDGPMAIYPADGEPTGRALAPSAIPADDTDVAWLADAAVAAVRERPEPMVLHLNWLRPHPPLVPPRPYDRLVDPEDVALPHQPLSRERQCELHPYFDLAVAERPMAEYVQQRRTVETIDEGDQRRIRAAYYGLCAEVDHHLGRVLAALRDAGRDRSTLVVFTSDHGDALGDRWLYGRRGPFDGHFTVPCLIHDPRPEADGTRGRTVDAFTGNIDLLPTILEAIGAPVPQTVEGRSLLGFVDGDEPDGWRSEIRFAMDWTDQVRRHRRLPGPRRFRGLRTAAHRYVEIDGFEPLLFDLVDDPDETVNRAGDPTLAAVREELAARVRYGSSESSQP